MFPNPRFRAVTLPLIVFILTAVLCSCSHIQVPTRHVVMFDEHSHLLDPTGNVGCAEPPGLCQGSHLSSVDYRQLSETQREPYILDVLAGLRAAPKGPGGKQRLLIFVHGGLNTQKGSVERVVELAPRITTAGYYPLFINWRSSLPYSYFDHLLSVRQGEDMPVAGLLTSPIALVYDLGRAVLRAPLVWASQLYGFTQSLPETDLPLGLQQRVKDLETARGTNPGDSIRIRNGEDKRNDGEKVLSGTSWFLLGPVRLVTAPPIDGFGTSSWDNMLRRTQLLVHPMEEYREGHPTGTRGDFAAVMKQLETQMQEMKRGADGLEVMLVGHSMGTIVLNEIIREFPGLPVDTIVYMAAACSVKDFEQSVVPYLARNTSTKFYNLSLHHMAEVGEKNELDLVMRGSLLTWIDDFFANPMTPKEKTLGQHVNFLRTEQIFPAGMRGRIHQKEFSYGKSVARTDPQKHGDFDRCPFWEKGFYGLDPAPPDPKLYCSEE